MNRSKGQTKRRAEERKVETAEERKVETKEAEHRRSNPIGGFGIPRGNLDRRKTFRKEGWIRRP